jgi:mono/diheme cytochrome c family protein
MVPLRARFRGVSALALLAATGSVGCNALDAADEGSGRLVPTDDRQAIRASAPPPPLSGGTLLVTRDSAYAVVADEARDRVSVIHLATRELLGHVSLDVGAQPGRLAQSSDGLVHVVLRRAGAVASIRLSDLSVVRQVSVCAAPRGLAHDSREDQLYVACASGRFVTLGSSGEVVRSVQLPNDLRDVVVENDRIWVSRFRSAEVLRVDPEGAVAETLRPPALTRSRVVASNGFTETAERFEPGVAWRLQANPAGGVVLVHQRATTAELELEPDDSNGGSPYGGGANAGSTACGGLQRSSLTSFDVGGQVLPGPDVGLSLPIDVALRSDGQALVVGAGRADMSAPRSSFFSSDSGGIFISGSGPATGSSESLITVDLTDPVECNSFRGTVGGPVAFGSSELDGPEQYVVAVAADPSRNGTYLVQTREPAKLVIVGSSAGAPVVIPLGGESVADTGFDLFHRNAEAGISCASCHPDGSDDGHVWSFKGQGLRRTQPLDVGLAGTAPFHWDGSLGEVGELMGEVFVNRMGGVHQGPERLAALTDWLFGLAPPAAEAPLDEGMVFRGRRLFESLEVGCADCHRGQSFTDNNSYDVGTGQNGEKFQVPSLLGIGSRWRFIHDGCASSLRERFELDCAGGDKHGQISQLGPSEIDDLVAYLQTL